MKQLLKLLFGTPNRDKNLRHFLKTEFKEELIPLNMPNVGTYKPGPRTSHKTNK